MNTHTDNNWGIRPAPQEHLESPFLSEDLFAGEATDEWDARLDALEAESPFLQGFGTFTPSIVDTEEEEDFEYTDDEFSSFYFENDSPLSLLSPSESKAVRITSTFETGRAGSFGGLTGNFDGQGVSFGLMNFAWKAGSLITLLQDFIYNHPQAFSEVFGRDAARFQEIVMATKADSSKPPKSVRDVERQMVFARTELNDANNKIKEPWLTYFGKLEANSEFQQIQINAVRKALDRAQYWCKCFELTSERAFVFMFDLVTTHGAYWLNASKFHGKRIELLNRRLKEKQAGVKREVLTDIEKLEVIANMIADVALEKWKERVRKRKLWFVKGVGEVQGKYRDIQKDYGVTDEPPDFGDMQPMSPKASFSDLPTSKPHSNMILSKTISKRQWIRFAQQLLNSIEGEKLGEDGILGEYTYAALKRFRRKHDVTIGDTWGNETKIALVQRAIESIEQQSIFPQRGISDISTGQALVRFKSEHGLDSNAILDNSALDMLINTIRTNSTFRKDSTSPSDLAREILQHPKITLAHTHVSNEKDNANAYQNIKDTANGLPASRSKYKNAPGGTIYLQLPILNLILSLAESYQISISEIAGGSHSKPSRHYVGVAIDVNRINDKQVNIDYPDVKAFMQRCRDLGCTEVIGPPSKNHHTHIHAALPRPKVRSRNPNLAVASQELDISFGYDLVSENDEFDESAEMYDEEMEYTDTEDTDNEQSWEIEQEEDDGVA